MKPVKIGLIGAGAISFTYLRNMNELFCILDVKGCSDLIEARSQQRADYFHIQQMTNDEIFTDPEIEIVVNTTYPLSHSTIQQQAIEAGKHVFSEKMMAENFPKAKELYDLAAQKKIRLGFAPDTFLGAGLQTARKILDAGLIGEPFGAQAMVIRGNRLDENAKSERISFVFSEGGNIPFDMGGYYLHALINMFGSIKRVTGFTSLFRTARYLSPRHPDYKRDSGARLPSLLTGALEFENGVLANLTTMSESHLGEVPRLEIYGTEGTLILPDPNSFQGPVYLARGKGSLADRMPVPLTHAYGHTDNPDPGSGACPEERNWRNSFRGLGVCDMAWAMRNNRPHRCSAEMGLHAMEVIYGIQHSGEKGHVYTMTTKVERPAALPSGYIYGDAAEAVFDS